MLNHSHFGGTVFAWGRRVHDEVRVSSSQEAVWATKEEIEEERRWDALFARSQDFLARLADEALAERRAGLTQLLDLDTL